MRRALPWLLGAVLVVAAAAVTAATPPPESLTDPFLTHGQLDERVSSRTLVATASEAMLADEITVSDSEWQAQGNWMVVTVTASARTSEVDAAIQLATFTIDGKVFQSSERPSTSLENAALRVGTDTAGVLAFELPAELASGTGELRLITAHATPELDDVTVIDIDLDRLTRVASTEISEPQLGGAS